MFKLAVLLAVLTALVEGAPETRPLVPMLDGRIVGGSTTSISNYPFNGSLQRSNSHICGAAIISNNWLLTAAHCVAGGSVSSFSIRVGSSTRNSGGQVISASRVVTHGNYNSRTIDYDIAAIYLSSAITSSSAARIGIIGSGSGPSAGTTATITGWGATSEGGSAATTLQVVQVPIVSLASCRSSYGTSAVTERMLCAGVAGGGRDACQGDSGGPLVTGGVLSGLVSWGNGCARPNYPGVYANVAVLRGWVSSTTGI